MTTSFAVRVDEALLEQARQVCVARDENLSQVVRRALRDYIRSAPPQLELEAVISAAKGKKGKRP